MRTSTHSFMVLVASFFLFAASLFILSLGVSRLAHAEDTGQYISNSAITAKVKAALLSDSVLKSTHVSVVTTQGVVQLIGTVDTKAEESEALNATKDVKGVKKVNNLLSVKSIERED